MPVGPASGAQWGRGAGGSASHWQTILSLSVGARNRAPVAIRTSEGHSVIQLATIDALGRALMELNQRASKV